MWFAAAVSSALLFGLAGWWMKVSQMQGGSSVFLFLGLYFSGAAGFAANGVIEGTLGAAMLDPRVWAAGVLIGAGSAIGNALFMKAIACGPASLTSPLTNMNIILVIGLGTFVYDEPLTAFELSGVLLLLAAVVLISIKRGGQRTRIQPKWNLYVGLSILLFAVRNGGLKVTDAIGLNGTPVLFAAYLLSFIGFAWIAVRNRSLVQPLGKISQAAAASATDDGMMTRLRRAPSVGLKWGLVAGLFSYAGLQLYAVALQTGQANIAGPIFAANSLVVAAGSIALYRERLTALQWSAFVLMFAGLILIRM
ncbi:EamA family transporter [Paenibacillus rhizovicinus]|uniref:EamA family transporter n=1 Tax=Paenibacillus rhizovicinus TaxID=2704463 RepID=A0A6C0NWW4_9BACL|nr:EamA family transporter [Paenibacillus rhizovicinus]QHW30714.1 EamA family transporter [Paenibacillus rhizovicinus]